MINNNNSKRGGMYKQKKGAIALVGLVVMFVVVVAGSLLLASNDDNSITGASIGVQEFSTNLGTQEFLNNIGTQEFSGACNFSITESVSNIGHDFLCQNTDGFQIDASNIVFDCQGHYIKCGEGCNSTTNTVGIRVNGRSNVTIQNCYVYNFTEGVRLENGATNNLITRNYLYNNSDGIEINLASGNNVTRNIIDENVVCGINVTTNHSANAYSSFNNVWDNKILNTTGGLEACSNQSSYNYWYTAKNCGSGSVNIIDGPCLGGNSWLSYTGIDITGDGLGDSNTPYNGGGILWSAETNATGDYNPLVDSSCGTMPSVISESTTCGNTTINSSSGEGKAIAGSNIVFTCNGTRLNGNGSAQTPSYADDMRGIEIKNVNNVTVVGCEIYNFTYGVYIQNSYNINLVNLTVRDNNFTGIYIGALAYNITVENSIIGDYGTEMQKYGVWLHGSRPGGGDSLIRNNIFVNNTQRGIYLSDSSDRNSIISNNISGSTDGVFINESDGHNIYNNTIYNNSNAGINSLDSDLSGSDFGDSSDSTMNTLYNNTYGYYLKSSSAPGTGLTGRVYNNTYGVYLQSLTSGTDHYVGYAGISLFYNNSNSNIWINNSNNIYIDLVNISGSNYGIYAINSNGLNLSKTGDTFIFNNSNGLYLSNVNNSNFVADATLNINNNTNNIVLIESNFNKFDYITVYGGSVGVNLTNSSDNNFTTSTISNFTSYNLYLNNSNNNTFYNNYLENTSTGNLVSDDGINIWNTTYTCTGLGNNILGYACWGGNYWGNYTGADLSGDGIGNTLLPYNNSGNIVTGGDSLPLTKNLAGCGTIVADVTIVQNVSSNGTCFVVNAVNITMDFAGKTLTGNGTGCGVNISNKDGVKIINANIQNFTTAICVDPAININISDNNLTQNNNGITFVQINNSYISNNKIFNNTVYGIQLNDSHNNNIFTNNITLNGYGLSATSSNNNTIYDNYFNNTIDASDSGSNQYNTTYAINTSIISGTNTSIIGGTGFGGNFWSTYLGKDSGGGTYPYNLSGDYVGDTNIPFTLGNINDYLPLTTDNGTTSDSSCLSIGASTKLASNVNCTTGDGITITASNIALDCDGKVINGGGIGSGILINNYDNVVIKNCNITNFYYGVKVLSADGTQIIEGNDLRLNDFYGIYLYQTENTLIDSNSLINDNNGVYMIGAGNTTITNNTINLQKKFYGIYGFNSNINIIANNTLWDNYHGIYLVNSSYTNASNNNITSSDVYSLFVHKSTSNSYFTNNNLSTGLEAVRIKSSSNNNQFIGNIITNHTNYGVYSTDSDSNTFTNNSIQNNSANVYLSNSKTNNFVNNSITLGASGIQALSSSNGLILTNNTINSTTNTTASLEINDSSDADISDNRFYNDVKLNNADRTTMDLNNSVITNLNITGSDNLKLSGNTLQYVNIKPTTGTNVTGNTMTQLIVLQFADGEISSNTIANNNLTAFNLQTVTNTNIIGNDIQNTTLAILLSSTSTSNSIYDNWIKDNSFGLNITSSTLNTIYNNYLSNGVNQNVYDSSGNTWYTSSSCGVPNIVGGPCKGGNFYSDYYGLDNGANGNEPGDGVGDQPANYTIATGNTDNFPLVLYVARQYFDQNSPYSDTYNAYGNVSGLLSNEEAVPNEAQLINFTSVSDSLTRIQLTGLFNQSDVHAETLKINHTENKTVVNRSGVTGEANSMTVYLYHNYAFDAGVYICKNTYNLSLDETCSSGVNLTTIGLTSPYTLSHNNGYYQISGITNESITAGINKNGYCGANILHDVTLTESVNCSGNAFTVSADNVTIDFAGYTLTGNSSGVGINISSYNNTIIKNANLINFSTAIYVDPATGINITGSNISESGTGIYFSQINDSFIIYNMLWNNTVGINLSSSYNNTIYNNYFSNTNEIVDNGSNTYYVTNTTGTNILSLANSAFSLGLTVNTTNLGGNYWANYTGWDTSPNGFGDTLLPYNNSESITAGNGDLFPLTGIGEISCGGTTQNVTTNITLISDLTSTGTCFTVTGNNLNLNCGGYSLTGDGTNYGFDINSVNGSNISNCNVINFSVGININDGSNHSITDCTFENNTGAGITFSNTLLSNSSIFNVTIYGNSTLGINLSNSSFVNITNSTIYTVSTGLFLTNSSNNTITGNNVTNNSVGINLTFSNNNTIYNNYFNNTLNAQDDGTNFWNTSNQTGTNILGESLIGGNFWSDYNGTDNNTDGIGDTLTPHNVSGNITNGGDYLPLVVAAVCGDGVKVGSEACDASDFGSTNTSCTSINWLYGTITCSGSCALDTSACTNTTPAVATPAATGGGGGGGGGTTTTSTTNCTENWGCGSWSSCVGSKQTRNCNDINLCESLKKSGTVSKIIDNPKPIESRSCTMELVSETPLPIVPEKEPSVIGGLIPDGDVAKTATFASIAALLIFGGVYASWYLTSSRNRIKRKLRKIAPLLGQESHSVLKTGYLDIYHLYLKLSEGHKQNYYSKVTKLREKLEDQLKAEKQVQELLENRKGDIKEQKETYMLAYKQYQKLPEKVKQKYYSDLIHFRDQLERGKSS
jgi:parallel beta-helix repeat protein